MGTLYVVATPIGNLSDITERAQDILRTVGVVAAEDTRRTGNLLKSLGVRTKLISMHGDSPHSRIQRILEFLANTDVAYCTDAGSPGVSDPGASLTSAARTAGHRVSPIPGPSALTAALSIFGIESSGAVFLGFLPRRPSRRQAALTTAAATGLPVVIYSPPHQATAITRSCISIFGPTSPILICRELTKIHEEVKAATLSEALELEILLKARGEYVLIVGPGELSRDTPTDSQICEAMQKSLDAGLSLRDAAKSVASNLDITRHHAYQLGITLLN